MSGNKLLVVLLAVFSIFSYTVDGFYVTGNNSWKASTELVESLSRRRPEAVYSEERIPKYILPELLVASEGTKVTNAWTWKNKRRPEILALFRTHMYGRSPIGRPKNMSFDIFDIDNKALGGLATRKQVTVNFTGDKNGPSMDMLIYLPNAAKMPVPVFIILNFNGNHTVHSDSSVKLAENWIRSGTDELVKERAKEDSRGSNCERYPVEKILERGYGLATVYYGDIDQDFHDGFKNGVHVVFDRLTDNRRAPDAWGAIGAWAWGLSRAMDYFETDDDIDNKRVIVLGHSRLGKTALWAGAQDERFALVVSNGSGCGGAALNRRRFGETVESINTRFPHWFCENFKRYNGKENELPFDQHMLIALIAPRPVYVASADEDLWADPRGEFLACKNAEPVYQLLGLKGLGVETMPGLNEPVREGAIGYHIRPGRHELTEYDWQRFMDFADVHLRDVN